MKVIVAITGATGAIFGIRILEILKDIKEVETHLILSSWGRKTLESETNYTVEEVEALADFTYETIDLGVRISSGSFQVDAMIISPCSMKTLASIRMGLADNLISRAADVILKEGRKLILLTRETPLSSIHLENMLALSRMGTVILPPMPAFYNHPKTIYDIVDHIAYRTVDQLGIILPNLKRWDGLKEK
ncbi:non-oxidative hydroxyarylic acid decarboxylases subunit B [Clostridium diolis]|uniref:Probable UbiX-like flavin prenyltransferase n=1 Tax=Clostridium diolis TaxID=223919 RepID=A0AAV3W5U5_9CLOT|nr:non-oxidative hydroxyarylic acid decarboxylases subunit B [Clostridium diolis]QES73421.1 UbiX family flavin prenyltransferase [Clostridium diolis]GEA33673.1 putative UbiX-like flavin prenyltransferase [Clostridium diolis]